MLHTVLFDSRTQSKTQKVSQGGEPARCCQCHWWKSSCTNPPVHETCHTNRPTERQGGVIQHTVHRRLLAADRLITYRDVLFTLMQIKEIIWQILQMYLAVSQHFEVFDFQLLWNQSKDSGLDLSGNFVSHWERAPSSYISRKVTMLRTARACRIFRMSLICSFILLIYKIHNMCA